jgi:hypothetical protein
MAQAEYLTNAIRAPIPGIISNPCTSPICGAHGNSVVAEAGQSPRTIPFEADVIDDLRSRVEHQDLRVPSVYMAVLQDDTAADVSGGLDLRDVEGLLANLVSDITGTIQYAAMAGGVA